MFQAHYRHAVSRSACAIEDNSEAMSCMNRAIVLGGQALSLHAHKNMSQIQKRKAPRMMVITPEIQRRRKCNFL